MAQFENKFKVGEEVWVRGIVIGIEFRKKYQEKEGKVRYNVGGVDNKDGDRMFNNIETEEINIRKD